jgi:formiminotetrahydrofolate cyclodeaminase
MPRTKHGTDEDRQALDGVLQAVEHPAQHALDLVDDDAAAYDAVVAAYRKPKATEDQKAERRSAIEAALRGAAEVPLEVMRSCRAGLGAALEAARTGNPSASSDVGVAVELLGAEVLPHVSSSEMMVLALGGLMIGVGSAISAGASVYLRRRFSASNFRR